MIWLALAACSHTEPGTDGLDGPTDGSMPRTTADTGTTTTSPPPQPTGDTGTASLPCDPSPTLAVTSVTFAQPWKAHELEVTVDLSEPASVAVACTLRSDPDEVHLVEGSDPVTQHVLRVPGLLESETYDCLAAPVCPRATAPPTAFQVDTTSNPSILPSITTTTFDASAGDEYVLVNHSNDCFWQSQRLLVIDRQGRIRWWYGTPQWVGPSVDFRHHGGTQFAWGGGWSPNELGRPRLVDLYDGETYDSAVALPDVAQSRFHHDGKLLSDGRLLTLEEVDLDDRGTTFQGFRVRRVDPTTNTVDFEYHSQRGLDEGHLPGGRGDAWHANWVDIVDIDGSEVLLVSLCNLGWTVAIDVATGDWRWTFGAGGDFSLEDAAGLPLPATEFPQCEHGLEYDAGELLVYDNGVGRGFSRVVKYTLDDPGLAATLDWTWTEPDWWETTLGSVDTLPGGHVLVGMGHAECFSSNRGDPTTVVEFDPTTGTKLWEARYDALNDMAYRADWADPCALFANAAVCPDVAARLVELEDVLTP